jgi:hypothetical protein
MPTLTGKTPAATYNSLLTVNNASGGLDGTLRFIEDGFGLPSPLQLSTGAIALQGLTWPVSTPVAGSALTVSATSGQLEWYTTTGADVIAALGYTPANAASANFAGPLTVQAATLETQTTQVNSTFTTVVYTFANTTGGTIKLMCQVQDTSTNAFHSEEMFIVTDGSTFDLTGFAVVTTQGSLGSFDAVMSSGQVNLTFTATIATTKTVTVVALSVTA